MCWASFLPKVGKKCTSMAIQDHFLSSKWMEHINYIAHNKTLQAESWEMWTSWSRPSLSMLPTSLTPVALPLRLGTPSILPPEALPSQRAGIMFYTCSVQCPRHKGIQYIHTYYWLWRKCSLTQRSSDNYFNALLSHLSVNEMAQV